MKERLKRRLAALPRAHKRALMVLADVVLIPTALWLAFALKYDSFQHGFGRNPWLYVGAVVASVAIFSALDLYRTVVRYVGSQAVLTVLVGSVGSAMVVYVLGQTVAWRPVPASVCAVYALIALTWIGGSRFVARWVLLPFRSGGESVLVYGAGDAGVRLARALGPASGLSVAGFIDDKRSLQGSRIDGLKVYAPSRLPGLVADRAVSRVLLAIPTASRRRRAEIIHGIEELGVHVQTVPDLNDLLSGEARVEDIRDVDASDLLGRDAVPPKERLFEACIRGKVVMVTGAGGSIGSELCRQIVRLGPQRLVLFEMSELALYHIDRELRALVDRGEVQVEIVSLLGNAHHKYRVREIMQSYGVQTVYHAAAYKHVPIVEHNVIEGIHNNVISTWHAAEAALECGVESFVLVSTDKAVNPTNVMGATKRLAEMVLQGLQQRGARTRFSMVRFGNVLESSGSVVPLFREQIQRGGPVTVTHPDVIRYFMTIPEASQLVLQAGAMAQGGDVFVLDMGKPIRIADLARRMVRLSGLTVRDDENPEGDIEIRYTGLRPAEKLFEELLIGNNVTGTEHPMIMRAMEHSLTWEQMQELLHDLIVAMNQFDVKAARDLLMRGVREYRPSGELVDNVWCRRESERRAQSKVTSLDARRSSAKRDTGAGSPP
jgi:FlaA1/EpsC-like NDP-sugar epimerase